MFRRRDIERALPEVSPATIRLVINALRDGKQIVPEGAGPRARWPSVVHVPAAGEEVMRRPSPPRRSITARSLRAEVSQKTGQRSGCEDRGVPRLIAIYGPDEEARVDEQLERLSRATDEARRRDVGYLEVRRQPQAARFRELANLAPDAFAVLLISDSTEVARWDHVVEPDDIWRAFDAG